MAMRGVTLIASVLLVIDLGACGGGKKLGVNEPCATNSDCADDVCHEGICASSHPLDNGSPCAGNGECKSFLCAAGQCAAGSGPSGYACLQPEECGTGLICCPMSCGCPATSGAAPVCCANTDCCQECTGVLCFIPYQAPDAGP
jgi:hypothetical protein